MRDLTDLALRPCSPGVREEEELGAVAVPWASPSAEDCETVDAVECLRVNFARNLVFRSPIAIGVEVEAALTFALHSHRHDSAVQPCESGQRAGLIETTPCWRDGMREKGRRIIIQWMDGWKRKVISRIRKKWSCRRTLPVRFSGYGLPCLLCFALLGCAVQCSVVLSFVSGLASQCSNLFHSPFPSLSFPPVLSGYRVHVLACVFSMLADEIRCDALH